MVTGIPQVEELRRAPDEALSFYEAANDVSLLTPHCIYDLTIYVVQGIQTEYTLGRAVAENPYHVPVIRAKLTRNIACIFPDIREELSSAFTDLIPVSGQRKFVPASVLVLACL